MHIDEISTFIIMKLNEGNELKKNTIDDYCNERSFNLSEIYNLLLERQNNDSNSAFLLGIFSHLGVATDANKENASDLY